MSPKARQAKSKARSARYESMLCPGPREKEKEIEIFIPPGPRLGDRVVVAENLSKTYGEKVLFENLNFSLPPVRDRRDHRAKRRGENHALPNHHRAGQAGRRQDQARRLREARLCRAVARRPQGRSDRVAIHL